VEGRIESASGLKPAGPMSEGAPQSICYFTLAGQSYPQAGGLFSARRLQSAEAAWTGARRPLARSLPTWQQQQQGAKTLTEC